MNKKAALEIAPGELILLIIVALGIMSVLIPILGSMLSGDSRALAQETRVSLDNFGEGVIALVKSNLTECFIDFSLEQDLVFVAFDKTADFATDTATDRSYMHEVFGGDNIISKPLTCPVKACAMLCDVANVWDWGNDDASEETCTSYPRNRPIIFEKVNNFIYDVGGGEHDLILYSNLATYGRLNLKKETATKESYDIHVSALEKTVTDAGEPIRPCRDLISK